MVCRCILPPRVPHFHLCSPPLQDKHRLYRSCSMCSTRKAVQVRLLHHQGWLSHNSWLQCHQDYTACRILRPRLCISCRRESCRSMTCSTPHQHCTQPSIRFPPRLTRCLPHSAQPYHYRSLRLLSVCMSSESRRPRSLFRSESI